MPQLTPAGWLALLERRLAEQQQRIRIYEDYYAGNHRLAFATAKFRQSFGHLFKAFADNWCRTVVDAPVERLAIEGFHFGDEATDRKAWDIFQANQLDAGSSMLHTEAIKDGRAYILVAPPAEDGGVPRITVEHPSQCIVVSESGNMRNRLAGLKKWIDAGDGHGYAVLYLPDQIVWYRTTEEVKSAEFSARNLVQVDGLSGANIFNTVPLIPVHNNPTMLGGGQSDLDTAIPLQDAINKELMDMLIASEFAAFRQRVLMGVEVPTDDDGRPKEGFEATMSASRLLILEDPQAKIAEFEASDLKNYTVAVETLLQHLAAQTRTPPHYLLGQIVNASGDALKAAETDLVAKVKRKMVDFGEPWEEAMRLSLKVAGSPARTLNAETVWRDPEYRSEGESVDAAVKLRSVGVPLEAIWERIGATPQQITEWKRLSGLPDRPPAGATTADVTNPS